MQGSAKMGMSKNQNFEISISGKPIAMQCKNVKLLLNYLWK